jgi:hypothetical protein
MKINVVLLIFYLVDFIFGYFKQKQKLMKAAQLMAPRFAEMRSLLTNSLSSEDSAKMKPYNYKVIINVLKETDDPSEKPKDIKTIINLTKESINLLKKQEIVRKILYRE